MGSAVSWVWLEAKLYSEAIVFLDGEGPVLYEVIFVLDPNPFSKFTEKKQKKYHICKNINYCPVINQGRSWHGLAKPIKL